MICSSQREIKFTSLFYYIPDNIDKKTDVWNKSHVIASEVTNSFI